MAKTKRRLTDQEILKDIMTRPTVPVWPHAGWAYGIGKSKIYDAANTEQIEVVWFGRSVRALTAPMRQRLGIKSPETATA